MSISKSILFACLGAGLILLTGCEPQKVEWKQPDWAKPKPEQKEDEAQAMEFARLKKENKKLHSDVTTLTSQKAVLDGRVKELLDREERLTQELNNLKLDNAKLKEQVKILGDVPAQRDRYKLQLDSAQKKIIELQTELEKLKKKTK